MTEQKTGWEALNVEPSEQPAEQKTLQSELGRTLANSPVLKKYLNSVVKGGTYAHGRTLDNVAFAEGQRALARTLLQLGGQFDE